MVSRVFEVLLCLCVFVQAQITHEPDSLKLFGADLNVALLRQVQPVAFETVILISLKWIASASCFVASSHFHRFVSQSSTKPPQTMNTQLTIPDPKASLASVPDPTDWDDTKFPLLNPLDSALRCDICKDFYNSPVITNCSHTFCSGCIRRALNAEQICPICRSSEQEYRLRKNPVVQELVDVFLSARPKLLEVAMEVVPVPVQQVDSPLSSQSEEEESSSPPAKRSRPSSRVTRSTRTTPKYTEEHGDDIVEVPAPSESTL